MCRIFLLLGVIALPWLSTVLLAQPAPEWTAVYDIDDRPAQAEKVQVDSSGNVYVAGHSHHNNTSIVAVVKYSADGTRLWSQEQTFPSHARLEALAVSPNREVYAVMTFYFGSFDIVVTKYSEAGVFQWQRQFNSGGDEGPQAAVADAAGNIYVSGSINGAADYLVLKYTSEGVLSWVRTHSESLGGTETGQHIAVDMSGNVYVSGTSYRANAGQSAATTLKFDVAGNLEWVASFLTGTYVNSVVGGLAVDSGGNIYVGSTASNGLTAIKYDSGGAQLWASSYDAPGHGNDFVVGLKLDGAGNVYVTASSPDTADIVTMKVDAGGARQWRSRYNGANDAHDRAIGLAVDSLGQVFVGGNSFGGGSQQDIIALQYDANGSQQWEARFDHAGQFDAVNDIAGGPASTAYLAGNSPSTNGTPRFITLKYVPAIPADQPRIAIPPRDVEVVAGRSNITFAITPEGPGPLSYQWRYNGRDIPGATGQFYSIPNADAQHAGEYSVRVSNAAGVTVSPEALLIVHRPPVIYQSPFDQTVVEGRTVMLSVYADGDQPLHYQWHFNGSPLPNETNQILRLFAVTTNATGSYMLEVSNIYGRATTAPAQLTVVPRGPLDRWTWRSPAPQGNELADIAYGNGRFVAVGQEGTVIVSTNGTDWSVHSADFGQFAGIAYGEGLFVAVAFSGLFTSVDGVSWTPRHVPRQDSLYGVTYGAGRFVAVGGGIVSSDDGVTWVDSGQPFYGFSVTYGNGIFLATRYDLVLVSSNGLDWTQRQVGGGPASVAFGNGLFVGHNYTYLLASTDGANWQRVYNVISNGYFAGIDFANGQFIALGSKLLTSSDGFNWTQHLDSPDFSRIFLGAVGAPGQTIAVGDDGIIYRSTGGTWTQVGGGTPNNLRGIVYANNRFTVVGNDGVIWYSADGLNFTRTVGPNTNNLRAIAYGNDIYVIAGSRGALLTSPDGFNWTSRNLVTNDLYGLVFVNGHFLAVGGEGRIIVSTNARDWTRTFGNTGERLQGIAYGGGRYVATGRRGYYAWSSNAVNWTPARNPAHGYLEAITYTNGLFVAVGANGAIFTSGDGISWAQRITPSGRELESVIYADGQFIAAGDNGTIMTSSNGVGWLEHRALTRNSFRQIIYARGALWGVGNNDMVMLSGQLRPYLTIGPLTPRTVSLSGRAEPAQSILLERSSDLENWETLIRLTPSEDGTFGYQDRRRGRPRPGLQRFYRATSP